MLFLEESQLSWLSHVLRREKIRDMKKIDDIQWVAPDLGDTTPGVVRETVPSTDGGHWNNTGYGVEAIYPRPEYNKGKKIMWNEVDYANYLG